MPLISICIPTHNHAHFLSQAIDSCLSQQGDFEVVVLDDHSTDATPTLRARYSVDPRLTWHRKESTTTVMETYNHIVSLSSGYYIKFLNTDDVLLPGSIARFEAMIGQFPQIALHAMLAEVIDEHGGLLKRQIPASPERVVVSGPSAVRAKLRHQVRFREPSLTMFKRSVWEGVGGFDPALTTCHDIWFNVQVMAQYPCAMWPEYWVQLRRYSSSLSKSVPVDRVMQDSLAFVARTLVLLGSDQRWSDRSAGQGYVLYRYLELVGLFLSGRRTGRLRDCLPYVGILFNPLAWWFAIPVVCRVLVHGDVQQPFSQSPVGRNSQIVM